jgi:hypothetical protein
MDGTTIIQGTFTQPATPETAVNQTIAIPSGVDWMRVTNLTQAAATGGNGFEFYWQLGMGTIGTVLFSGGSSAVTVGQTAANAFVMYNPSNNAPGALNNGSTEISAFSNATPPVATVGSTAGMQAGSVVRIINLAGASQISGMDFTVGYGTFSSTTFSLDYIGTQGSGVTTGSFRVIPYSPLFYPPRRYITSITQAANAVVTTSVQHTYTVGQQVRFTVPSAFGMTQINGLTGNIIAVNTATGNGNNTFTVDINSSAFTAFAFPTTTSPYANSPALVVPVGENTATALTYGQNILADATVNTGFIGMTLAAGAGMPAGVASDKIFWVAGKSTLGGS